MIREVLELLVQAPTPQVRNIKGACGILYKIFIIERNVFIFKNICLSLGFWLNWYDSAFILGHARRWKTISLERLLQK